ncbi:MAG: hypothetical protein M1826_005829 [Phylliscum demangeonii]|nr:MAG: hypothetical protein M1826_005829 [Phylliscum demangeonii]
MALVQTTLTWLVYGLAVALLMCIAAIFVCSYQAPGNRSAVVSTVSIVMLTSLLATILLLPVDIALVSSTTSRLGRKKPWATPDHVHKTLLTLRIVYYALYSLDAFLCLVVAPFTYFWYEEYDEVDATEGNQSVGRRLWGAVKYTLAFVLLMVVIFLVGFFLPVVADKKGRHLDLGYFKNLLTENHGARAATFALGLLSTVGTVLYVVYTAPGFALFPISLIKSAPSISSPATASALEQNRELQRQLEGRYTGRGNRVNPKDRRELDALVREERTLLRRQRLAAEAAGEGQGRLMKAWAKTQALFRPLKLLGGILLLLVGLLLWVSMLLTGIDKAKNSMCKIRCGYILGHNNIFNPVNWILVTSARVFPVDYIIFALVVLFFFGSSIVGLAAVGIRFLWLRIFQIRKGRTSPQALLLASVMLTLISLAINYALVTLVAPQYATFGAQRLCTRTPKRRGEAPDCSQHPALIRSCTEVSDYSADDQVCTPSVLSTFVNRINLNFPFFGDLVFWAQFAFLAVYLVVFLTALIRTPTLDETQLDRDAEEAEEEGLLASTGRRFGATWQDLTGNEPGGSSRM